MEQLMSVKRIEDLEKAFFKLDTTLNVLVDRMGEMSNGLSKMSDAVQHLAVTNTKLDHLSNDVSKLADALRSSSKDFDNQIKELHVKIDTHIDKHYDPCINHTDTTFNRLDLKLVSFFVASVSVAVFLFWLNHDDLEKVKTTKDNTIVEKTNENK